MYFRIKWKEGELDLRHLRRNCLLKHVIEWNWGGTTRRGRTPTQLLGDIKHTRRGLEVERGGTRWHCVANWLWQRL